MCVRLLWCQNLRDDVCMHIPQREEKIAWLLHVCVIHGQDMVFHMCGQIMSTRVQM